ncbi:MAG: MotA/TolQ/ExbB proton channel family protein [Pseudomonadota bacterium]|nr:MotA/TolQ/ExbB proton channel family protein [Pseudomonadota bacterium]
MDLATVIGIVGAFALVVAAMSTGGGLTWFLDGPSAMIVFGGTFGAVLVNYRMSDMLSVLKVAKHAFFKREFKTDEIVRLMVDMSRQARKEGILSLQNMGGRVKDPFLGKAVNMMLDGYEPALMANILETELDSLAERHRLGAEIFTSMGNFAPAMGMMGTLIGLIQMLMKMEEPSSIGPSMSVALITTFYGVILANLVFHPISGKLRTRSAEELLVKRLIIKAVMSIQAGDNPRILEQKLHSFIAPTERRSRFYRD